MKRCDIVKELKEKASLKNLNEASDALDAMEEMIREHIKDDGGFSPFRGVVFYASYKEAHKSRNPRTGDTVEVAAKYRPNVRFTQYFKDSIN